MWHSNLQEVPYPDWDQGLPPGLLEYVARGLTELRSMRSVSKNRQRGFEGSVSKLRIRGLRNVDFSGLLPADGLFSERFFV